MHIPLLSQYISHHFHYHIYDDGSTWNNIINQSSLRSIKIAIWGWQTPQLPRPTRKSPKSDSWEEGGNCSSKPWTCVEQHVKLAKIYILTSMMVWCQEDMLGARWLWWLLTLALLLVMVIIHTNFFNYFEKKQLAKNRVDNKTWTDVKTLSVQGPSYLCLIGSISFLLMPWLLTSPGHQRPWYWLCEIYLTRGRIPTTCVMSVLRNDRNWKYMFMFLLRI